MNEFRLIPESASSSAVDVDILSLALLGVSLVFSVGIALAILYFSIRYWHTRDVNRSFHQSNLMHWVVELTWILIPFSILLVAFAWGAQVFIRAHQPPKDALEIYVVAKQWMWKISHQGGKREINTLHAPIGRPVRLTMISEDVIHSFYVPAFRGKQDVLPGRYSTFWFEGTRPGDYHLFCAEYCGTNHSRMIGRVVLQTPDEYAAWLAENDATSLEQRGRRQVDAHGCLQCHGESGSNRSGPPLTGLFGTAVRLKNGTTVTADAGYIRKAILDPHSQTRMGYQSVMPSFQGQLGEEQIIEITAYLQSIADAVGPLAGPGFIDTPDFEQAPEQKEAP